jgi:flavodoxin
MKNLIVYYSWTGNTEVIANEIQKLTGGAIQKIEEYKKRKSGAGFMGAAFTALIGLKSRIKPMDLSLNGYDNIFIGGQVWAGRSTPAINTFISRAKLSGKKVYLFLTKADDKVPQKVIDSMTQRIERRGGKVIDSFSATTKMGSVISTEEIRPQLSEWIEKTYQNK